MSESKIRKKLQQEDPKQKSLSQYSNRPFLIVTTINRPKKDVKTATKGWASDPANWEIFERPRVEDRVTAKAMQEASVIVDIMQGRCIKNRFDKVENSEAAEHYLGKYMEECKKGLDVWLTRQARNYLQPVARPAGEKKD